MSVHAMEVQQIVGIGCSMLFFFSRNTSDKCLPYAHTYAHDLRRCGGGDGIVRQSVTICHTEYANAGASEYIMLTPNTHAAYSGAFAP